jgi:hypothetical protein
VTHGNVPGMSSLVRLSPLVVLWWFCALLVGGAVGVVGTVAHRQWAPWILLVSLLTVAVAGVLVRAWLGMPGLVAYALGWLAAVQLLALSGPGGDVLLPAQPLSYAWMFGGFAMVAVAAFAPRRWFAG